MSYIETNGYFYFGTPYAADRIKSSDYGVWITGAGTYNAPARRYKEYTVPGRNGTLTIDENAFEQIDHTYQAFIASNFKSNVESFRNAMMAKRGYVRLEDSYHNSGNDGEFYLAKYMSGLEVDVAPKAVGGSFKITFKRDPRRFIKSGETNNGVEGATTWTITNPSAYASKPWIRVYGAGSMKINGKSVTVDTQGNFPYVDIDSELMDCYYGSNNANEFVTLEDHEFPEFIAGSNSLTDITFTKFNYKGRWFRI